MLGAYGFLSRVFSEFEKHKLSVDVLASSEVSVSLTLDKKQNNNEIQNLIADLDEVADITRKDNMSILTLITDVNKSSEVLATVFRVFSQRKIAVEMLSQGASKVNISLILRSDKLEEAILHLHACFFEEQCAVPMKDVAAEETKEEVGI
jgi:aspartate kinase